MLIQEKPPNPKSKFQNVLNGILIVVVYFVVVYWWANRNPFESGSGHYAGFEWAKKTCPGTSASFYEGCEERLGRDSAVVFLIVIVPAIAAFYLGYKKKETDLENEDIEKMKRRLQKREEWEKGKEQRQERHLTMMKQNLDIRAEKRRMRNLDGGVSSVTVGTKYEASIENPIPMKTIKVAGVEIREDQEPHLFKIALTNPEGLAEQLTSLAKASGGSVQSAVQNLESDLTHG